MNLTRNVGRNDKNIRIAVGIALIFIGILFAKSFLLTLIGAVVLATGIFSFCALYQLLGMSTASSAETVAASDDLSERASENLEDFKEEALETAQELKAKAEVLADDLKEKAEDIVEDVKEEAEELLDEAKQKINETKDSLKK